MKPKSSHVETSRPAKFVYGSGLNLKSPGFVTAPLLTIVLLINRAQQLGRVFRAGGTLR
jgi:hypothetical protein